MHWLRLLLQSILGWIGDLSIVVDVLGVGVILVGIALAVVECFQSLAKHQQKPDRYDLLKVRIGKALLLGLEFLVAADVIRTVVLDLTLANLITLGLLVVIRTVLSWTLEVEIENRWPWQQKTG